MVPKNPATRARINWNGSHSSASEISSDTRSLCKQISINEKMLNFYRSVVCHHDGFTFFFRICLFLHLKFLSYLTQNQLWWLYIGVFIWSITYFIQEFISNLSINLRECDISLFWILRSLNEMAYFSAKEAASFQYSRFILYFQQI